jgi:hypothetical protein
LSGNWSMRAESNSITPFWFCARRSSLWLQYLQATATWALARSY